VESKLLRREAEGVEPRTEFALEDVLEDAGDDDVNEPIECALIFMLVFGLSL
jgi:hypothetical protein